MIVPQFWNYLGETYCEKKVFMQNGMNKSLIFFMSPALSPKLFFKGLDLQDRVWKSKMLLLEETNTKNCRVPSPQLSWCK